MVQNFYSSLDAVGDIPDGATILIGGFGICGMPHNLCKALSERPGAGGYRIVSNAGGMNGWGAALLFESKKVSSIIATRVGPACKAYEEQVLNKEIEIELIPQGTFAERIRAGGAGIGGAAGDEEEREPDRADACHGGEAYRQREPRAAGSGLAPRGWLDIDNHFQRRQEPGACSVVSAPRCSGSTS